MSSDELSPEELSSLLSSYMPEIPGYRVIRRIGKGGMSYVYLGVQVSLDRQVAIKVMSPEALKDEKSKLRFEQEAHTIAKLEHPCIVGVHEVGRTPQGLLYYVLPYLARGHLGQRDFTNDEARIIEVLRALLSALEYAHTRGIVHRDVKAENVLFDNADRPLLTDFGIALSRTDTSRITTAGLAVGSGGYMAPEQARGEAVDGRADLYSVGVLAYELLNGRLPYLSSDALGLALMHAQDPIPRLPAERRHWQAFIDRSMAKAPDNRFRNAQQMLGALNQITAKEHIAAVEREVAPASSAVAASPRRWLPTTVLVLSVAALLFSAAALVWPDGDEAPPTFFTGTEPVETPPPSAIPVAVVAPPEAAPDAPPAQPIDAGPEIEPGTTPDLPAPATAEAAIPAAGAYASVLAEVTVSQLEYDPAQPGSRQLRAAARQIQANRLSTPPGDNAVESLLSAHKAGAPAAETGALADRVLSGLATALVSSIRAGRDDSARATYRRANQFASEGGLLKGEAWLELRKSLLPALSMRLDKAAEAADASGFARARTLARSLDVAASQLDPAWSRTLAIRPDPPTRSVSANGPAVVPVVQPGGGRPGVAIMREEVSRSAYASFATSTGRPSARCRNRNAPISLKKRSWQLPGFEQTGAHPVVCISHDDAAAYALWLSQRTGEKYRLPSLAEWRLIAGYAGSGDACRDGQVDNCGTPGTVPTSNGPSSPLGLSGVKGNAREWTNDCSAACRQRQVTGLGWRDSAGRADAQRSSGFDASVGFDDVGFRLVREIPR